MSKFVVYTEFAVKLSDWQFTGYKNGEQFQFESKKRAMDYAENLIDNGYVYMGIKNESYGREFIIMVYPFRDD